MDKMNEKYMCKHNRHKGFCNICPPETEKNEARRKEIRDTFVSNMDIFIASKITITNTTLLAGIVKKFMLEFDQALLALDALEPKMMGEDEIVETLLNRYGYSLDRPQEYIISKTAFEDIAKALSNRIPKMGRTLDQCKWEAILGKGE